MTTPAEGSTPAAAEAVIDATNPAQAPTPAPAAAETPNTPPADPAPATDPAQIGADETPTVDPEAPTSADADEDGVITYAPTGDAGMDLALEFAGKLGLGMDDPAMAATVTGDWSLLEAKLAAMGDKAKGWEKMVELAKAADARFTEQRAAEAAAINTAVSGVLGDSEAAVLAWAGKAATPEEKDSINAMLRADPVQARAAAMLLQSLYEQAGGNTVVPASAMKEGSGSVPAQGETTPLTRSQFAVESGKLYRRLGAAYTKSPEYAALSARVR